MQRNWVLGAAAALLMALALAWAFAPRATEVEVAQVRTGRFEQSIDEDCRTRLRDRYTISAPVAGQLTRIALREGDRIAQGDTVAVLRPVMPSMVDARSRQEAQARLDAARAQVRAAHAGIERADVALQEVWLDLGRNRELADQGFIAPSRLDSSRLAVSNAAHALEAAQAERDMAVHQESLARAALAPLATGARSGQPFALQAPVGGVVLRVAQPNAATVGPGAALLDVGDPTRLEVLCELLTADAVQATPGRAVVMERWGGAPLTGQVLRVEPAAFTKVSALGIEEQRVNVLIALSDPPAQWNVLGEGFRVGVRIITRQQEGATLVPVGALFAQGDTVATYLLEGKRASVRTVDVAGRNASVAWVRQGLAAGQTVVVYPPPQLGDGASVQVRTP